MFMPKDVPQRLTLADIIMSKIKEKETELASQMSHAGACQRALWWILCDAVQARRPSSSPA